jgi:hypothetical protein
MLLVTLDLYRVGRLLILIGFNRCQGWLRVYRLLRSLRRLVMRMRRLARRIWLSLAIDLGRHKGSALMVHILLLNRGLLRLAKYALMLGKMSMDIAIAIILLDRRMGLGPARMAHRLRLAVLRGGRMGRKRLVVSCRKSIIILV